MKYIRTEYVKVILEIEAEDADQAEEIGNEYVDALLFDSKTLRKSAKKLDSEECIYVGSDSTGDSSIVEKDLYADDDDE
jgi:hypothetical protein